MNRAGLLVGASFFGLSIMGACSSDSNTPGGGAVVAGTDGGALAERVVNVDGVRAALKPLADAECKWIFQCCNADERAGELGPGPTATDCADRLLQAQMVTSYTIYTIPIKDSTKNVLRQISRLEYGYDNGRVTIDATAVQACAQSITGAVCNKPAPKDHCEPAAAVKDDPCDATKLLTGKQQVGDECESGGFDCAAGLLCESTTGEQGVCLKSPKAGDTCFDDPDCGNAVCDFTTGKCVDGGDVGAACSYADPDHPQSGTEKVRCRSGLICDTVTLKCADQQCAGGSNCQTDTTCPAGTACINYRCGTPVKGGELCSKDADCQTGRCSYDPVIMRQVCGTAAVDGSLCNVGDDCASHYCKYVGQTGGCAPQQPLDAPCPSGQPEECASGKCGVIDMGPVCQKGPAVGDACTSDSQCNPQNKLVCNAMKCAQAPLENGSDCNTSQACKSEVCVSNKCAAKGLEGASCGTAKSAPCDTDFYCAPGGDGSLGGTCKAKKPEGAPCTSPTECWNDCRASHGELRCVGIGPGQPHCAG